MRPMLAAAASLLIALVWGHPAESVDLRGENIYLGVTYTLDPPPNYGLCSDIGDLGQLTDGQYTDGYFSVHESTVGWQDKAPAILILDLGSVQPIRGISFSAAGGFADVKWPLTIRILVTEDQRFHEVGNLMSLSEQQHGPILPTRANPDIWVEEGFRNAAVHHHYLFDKDRFGPDFTEVRNPVLRDATEQRAASYRPTSTGRTSFARTDVTSV